MVEVGHLHERAARRLRDERGASLIELLMAMILALIVVAIPMQLVVSSLSDANRVGSVASTTGAAQRVLDKVVRDLRQASNLPQPARCYPGGVAPTPNPAKTLVVTASSATFWIPQRQTAALAGDECLIQVVWQFVPSAPPAAGAVTAAAVTRTVGAGAARTVARGVEAFGFSKALSATGVATSTDPASLSVTLALQFASTFTGSGGDVRELNRPVTVVDGVSIRSFGG